MALSLNPADRLEVFETLGSTHDEVLQRAREGDAGHLWILALQQTKGRGRHGRQWVSPKGNFYASYLLVDPSPLNLMPQLGFVAGVALADAVRLGCDLGDKVRLKWPNDLVSGSAKLSGLLLETTPIHPHLYACAIGFGVNLMSSPAGLAYETISLLDLGSRNVGPTEFALILSHYFAYWLQLWDRGHNFAAIRKAWMERAAGLGQAIRVQRHDGPVTGRFEGLDDAGRLLLRCGGRIVTIEAGDVFLV